MAARATRTRKKTTTPRKRRKKAEPRSRGLTAAEVAKAPSPAGEALAEEIRADGGEPLAVYREPLGGHTVVFASLPLELVEPTPYQRDVSEPHVKRLANAMERVDRFLDPLIAIRKEGRYWSPNGNHRLQASKLLGGKAVLALVLPEEDVAFQILALNTEKAHNLKERSLEVIRMYRGLSAESDATEASFAHLFEEPVFITFGAAYERRPRFAAGAYQPVIKRVDQFLDEPLPESLQLREERAERLLKLDDQVNGVVEVLKDRGLQSPYLKYFVVGRLNFLRFKKDVDIDFDEALERMSHLASRFDPGKVRREDLARMGGAPSDAAEI